MFEKFMMPLDRQYDDGHEVTADAFKEAAERLSGGHEGKFTLMNGHLPINFLYRHAVELYLKSSIITVHRALRLATGDGSHTKDPFIRIDGKWRAIHKTHSLKVLLDELTRMLSDSKPLLATKTPRSWETPLELVDWIDTIEAADAGSTYFRYPASKSPSVDSEKSGFLPIDPEKLVAELNAPRAGQRGRVVLELKDEDGNIAEIFVMQHEPLPHLRDALVKAAELMSGYAFGLYAELVCGCGKKWVGADCQRGRR